MRSLALRLRDDEHGSVTLLAGVAMAALLGATALAVDLGRVAVATREAQSNADLAALDAVRAVGDRRDASRDAGEHASALAANALARNEGFLDLAGAAPSVATTVGRFDPVSRIFTATGVAPNAISVTAVGGLPHAVLAGATDVSREAIAMVEAVGGVRIGSVLASADIDVPQAEVLDAVLGGLLGGGVDLDVVGYRGLADADVAIGELFAELGLGTVEEALASTVTVSQLASATATVLSRSTEASDTGAVTPLGPVAAAAGTSSLQLADLLTVGPEDGALDLEVDVLGMIMGAAAVANGTNAVAVALPVTIPGVASATATVAVVEPPRIALGGAVRRADGSWETTARTAQARVTVDLVLPGAISIPLLLGSITADLSVSTAVDLARGTAELQGVTCPGTAGVGEAVIGARTSAATAALGRFDPAALGNAAQPPVQPVTLVDVAGLVRVTGSGAAVLPGGEATLTFETPTDVPQRVSGGAPALGALTADATSVSVEALTAGIDTGSLTASVLAETQRVLRELDAGLLDDLAAALGVSVADADVWSFDVDCTGRRLVR